MLPFKSQNAISGSIIQNSLACRDVFEFSARNVGTEGVNLRQRQRERFRFELAANGQISRPREEILAR